jgi:hypothetical protein
VPCPDPGPGPDFFNNVAAVAVVLMFAKVVSHRSRKARSGAVRTWVLAGFHVLAVIAATVTLFVCLKATEDPTTGTDWHNAAWTALGITGAILVIDVILDAIRHASQTPDPGKPVANHP